MRFLAAAAILAAPAAANAAIVSFDSDQAFVAYETTDYANVGNGSILWGNAGPSGNFEYAIRGETDATVLAQGQIDWSQGGHALAPANGAFFYYAANGATSFAFTVAETGDNPAGDPAGPYALSANLGTGVTAVFVRARGPAAGTAAAGLAGLAVLFDSGGSVALGDIVADGDGEYVGLVDARLADGFAVVFRSGDFDFGTGTAGAVPALQVKVGVVDIPPPVDTPAPAALALFGLGVAALRLARRRR